MASANATANNLASFAIHVDDVDRARAFEAVAAAVEANGGRVTMTKSTILTVGTLIRFLYPEGNDIGAMQYGASPHT